MAFDSFGNWIEDDFDYEAFLQDPKNAPPNSTWNPDGGNWITTKPGEQGYDATWGGYTSGDPYGSSEGDKWLKSVYEAQGWELPGQTPPPSAPHAPEAPSHEPAPSGGRAPQGPSYSPNRFSAPRLTPSPFITPDGKIPPGLPYSPDMQARGMQDEAIRKMMTEQVVQPWKNKFESQEDALLESMLTKPALSPEYIARLNEQQKELINARGQASQNQYLQSAAGRGVLQGGTAAGMQRRFADARTQQFLQSQRDIAIQSELQNREGFERALGLSGNVMGARQDRALAGDLANRQGLLDAVMGSETIYGGREDRGLNAARLMESIRQFDNQMAQRQAEFEAGHTLDQDRLGFSYNNLNLNAMLDYIASLQR